eukprot:134264-Prymnesium_polylepis.1
MGALIGILGRKGARLCECCWPRTSVRDVISNNLIGGGPFGAGTILEMSIVTAVRSVRGSASGAWR